MKRLMQEPGSVRHSLTVLGTVAVTAVVLLGLADGAAAAATGLALITVVALAVVRYVAGADSQDSGYRKSVRLLGGQRLAVGDWQLIVRRTLGEDAEIHFGTTMRPQLQRLFAARLAEVHGVELHRDPRRAAALVGPDLWPWIDPQAGPPQPVLTEQVLRTLLDRLETLSTARPLPRHDQAQ
ncbi:hypothetical protein V2S66_17620 [Streptomyces sp. V4-01]|uniref:PH domain-containing protein n=1 Tax=Actinacidiphila polyblastidii TaxID=3110430 RepID=A0ABU7PDC1_9ACTN|nr:hypothetical protein [Streptomyces sp. V4-01]